MASPVQGGITIWKQLNPGTAPFQHLLVLDPEDEGQGISARTAAGRGAGSPTVLENPEDRRFGDLEATISGILDLRLQCNCGDCDRRESMELARAKHMTSSAAELADATALPNFDMPILPWGTMGLANEWELDEGCGLGPWRTWDAGLECVAVLIRQPRSSSTSATSSVSSHESGGRVPAVAR